MGCLDLWIHSETYILDVKYNHLYTQDDSIDNMELGIVLCFFYHAIYIYIYVCRLKLLWYVQCRLMLYLRGVRTDYFWSNFSGDMLHQKGHGSSSGLPNSHLLLCMYNSVGRYVQADITYYVTTSIYHASLPGNAMYGIVGQKYLVNIAYFNSETLTACVAIIL